MSNINDTALKLKIRVDVTLHQEMSDCIFWEKIVPFLGRNKNKYTSPEINKN